MINQSEKEYNVEESTDLNRHNLSELDDEEEEQVDKSITFESYTILKSHFADILNDEVSLKTTELYENHADISNELYDTKELRTSELCPVPADDLDSTSDISSIVTQDATQESNKQYEDYLEPICNQKFVYNSMFVDLSNARLTVLPDNIIQHFSTIQMLYLENNALTEIPDELFPSLQNLEWLDVRNNQLQSLPNNIKFHTSLHTLLLQGNLIQMLPLELCLIPKLKNLQVARNPLIMPPENVVALGFASILTFLKIEWNKLHPDKIEIGIIPVKQTKPKSLTVVYKDSNNKDTSSMLQVVNCSTSCSNISNKFDKISMIEKRKAYKPSNRCVSKGIDLVRQNQLLWINKITEMLNKEASVLQKMKDKITLQKWRDDKTSFHKSMEKATKRRKGDIPFAIEDVNDLCINNTENNSKDQTNLQTKNKSIFISPANINKRIIELLDSLNTINMDGITNMTSISKQQFLNDTIKKVHLLQKEIHHLQRYNISTS
ncbi:PREDICTED: probable serine/threonine-protein kinase roco4 [Polistes dominula]|uniref:Probable serine/threonine-protein kinase roco4 n=1 Tax=Polistes dominula TaxID=743375 RepID=A0ABM1HXF4_POLDO|nr:PREDICTED: probable serine/threonine-protein kinase roco4 [Polistes dominula]